MVAPTIWWVLYVPEGGVPESDPSFVGPTISWDGLLGPLATIAERMSGDTSAMAPSVGDRPGEGTPGGDLQTVLDALADPDCRCILRAVSPSALTARECSERCDLPLSTTYRKLELLGEAGLVVEELRLRRDGKHASQYRRRFDGVHVEVAEDGTFGVDVSPRELRREEAAAPGDD